MSEQTFSQQETGAAPPSSRISTVAELANQLCPNCKTGVLAVVTYDPEATYAAGQGEALANPAHAAYSVLCRQCTFGESRPIPSVNQRGGAV